MATLAYIIIVALSVLRLARSNGEIDFVESSIINVQLTLKGSTVDC
jgi:L-lactate permease